MELEKFENIIEDVLLELPHDIREKLKNISIIVEEKAISPVLDESARDKGRHGRRPAYILGLYQGLPLTRQAGNRNIYPHRITIYKSAIEALSQNDEEIEKNVRRVILHELGHYFGIDEKTLGKLGY
ncbi:MAG: metallopeptidase family protein [Actinobacteria bacterium]|nr:metallopeptidase family protein [Actinomycetota bacterium]